jgi:hypothetical protein
MTDINPNFLGYELDLAHWRREYDAIIAEHGSRDGLGYSATLAEGYGDPGELELLGFIGCCHWLNGSNKTQTIPRGYTTYHLKHAAEAMMRDRKGPYYVSQNILEMAALHEGYKFTHIGGNKNASINLSVRDADGAFRSQPGVGDYYWFYHQPVITYPVEPVRLTAAQWRRQRIEQVCRKMGAANTPNNS